MLYLVFETRYHRDGMDTYLIHAGYDEEVAERHYFATWRTGVEDRQLVYVEEEVLKNGGFIEERAAFVQHSTDSSF